MRNLTISSSRARRILTLAAPAVIAMLTQTSINVVDTIFVGKLDPGISTPGQAALGFSLPMLWAVGGSLSALGVGTQAMSARRVGAEDLPGAGRVLTNSLIIAALAAIAASAVAWFVVPDAFRFLSQNEAVLAQGIPYARLRLLGVLSMVATAAYKGFFDGLGETKVHMYAALVMNAANIGLNYALIFGLGPIPAMHVPGAALASLISTYIGLTFMIGWSLRARYREYSVYRRAQLSRASMWALVKLSTPSGMAQIFIMVGVLLFLKVIGMLDDQATAAELAALQQHAPAFAPAAHLQEALRVDPLLGGHLLLGDWARAALLSRPPLYATAAKLIVDLMSVAFVTCIAFGTATATLVSQHLGAGEPDEAAACGWDSVKIAMLVYGALGLSAVYAPEFYLGLLSHNAVVIQIAAPGLQLMGGLQMFLATAMVLTQALFGAGDTRFVMFTELVLHAVCLAPLSYLLAIHLDLGFLGVWLSAAAYITLLAMAVTARFRIGSWRTITV